MRFNSLLDSYIADEFRASEAKQAIDVFLRRIPGRVLQMEFDAAHTNKQGVKDGNKVYKLGLDLASGTAFIEYLDDPNQAQPTMALFVCKNDKSVTVNGWQVDKKLRIRYTVADGQVRKSVSVS